MKTPIYALPISPANRHNVYSSDHGIHMKPRITPQEKIESLREKRDQLNARVQRESAKLRSAARKEDTRRKIIAGAIALEHAEHDPAFREALTRLLREHVKETDRKLFDLV